MPKYRVEVRTSCLKAVLVDAETAAEAKAAARRGEYQTLTEWTPDGSTFQRVAAVAPADEDEGD